MRTKEIEVWIDQDQVNFDHTQWIPIQNKKTGRFNLKAKLIIELPEKKVEITETQLAEAFEGYLDIATECGKRAFENARKRLFESF